MIESRESSLGALLLPMVGSLLLTGMVAALLCEPTTGGAVSRIVAMERALLYVAVAGAAHLAAVWAVCGVFAEHIGVGWKVVLAGTWMSVAWFPLLVLLMKERSVLVVAVPVVMMLFVLAFLKRWRVRDEGQEEVRALALFAVPQVQPLWRTVLPAALSALVVQGGMISMVLGNAVIAGVLFAGGMVFPVWMLPGGERRVGVARVLNETVLVVAITALALGPGLLHVNFASVLRGVARIPGGVGSLGLPATQRMPDGSSYSGVVLILPEKLKEKVVPPKPVDHTQVAGVMKRTVVIPFDGVYWYFKRPDARPKADARRVKGDPLRENVRSTDWKPLVMEAHEFLGDSIVMDCCSAIRVAVRNADNRPGAIAVEVVLRENGGKGIWLGSQVIASSKVKRISLTRGAVDEVLSFRIPVAAKGRRFNEIAVGVRPARERALAGAKVAVQRFELVP